MTGQITNNILMIRPVGFRFNEETALNNYYQKTLSGLTADKIQERALNEFDVFVSKLRKAGINVLVEEDTMTSDTPDSIFPNNWISFHADGRIGLYPMFAKNRRSERRKDILESISKSFEVSEIIDFSHFENTGQFLEGTGSLILDRQNKLAYAAISERTNTDIVDEFCRTFDYQPIKFHSYQSVDGHRRPIYHTNVMMCVGELIAIICLDSIDNTDERSFVNATLIDSGKQVIPITEDQVNQFAGNMLQVVSNQGEKIIVMSTSAFNSLSADQKNQITKHNKILHGSLDTIEACGGGSARCMMAEVFLKKR